MKKNLGNADDYTQGTIFSLRTEHPKMQPIRAVGDDSDWNQLRHPLDRPPGGKHRDAALYLSIIQCNLPIVSVSRSISSLSLSQKKAMASDGGIYRPDDCIIQPVQRRLEGAISCASTV